VLGQIATEVKSNKITAVPKLLQLLSLEGCTVTVDALNCQRAIAQQILDQQGDYVMALKANQAGLHDDVRRFLDDPDSEVVRAQPVVDGDHSRIETRTATVATGIAWLQAQHGWRGLPPSARCTAYVRRPKMTEETTYYLLSAAMTPERFGEVARSHWGSRTAYTGASMSA
jgi:predicted transposase YbfD/YdcC